MKTKTMTETKHSPTPWECGVAGEDPKLFLIGSAPVFFGSVNDCPYHDGEANARFIIRAVNSHDDLLAACKAMLDIDNPEPGHQGHITAGEARRMAAAAVRKAEPT